MNENIISTIEINADEYTLPNYGKEIGTKLKKKIGVSFVGGNPANGRRAGDFYPTPRGVTTALMKELNLSPTKIWECCCGTGDMAEEIKEFGHDVIGTDLFLRGYGQQLDVLKSNRLLAPIIITNPPFALAGSIIEHLCKMQPEIFALLLKSTFWQAKKRIPLFNKFQPSRIMALSWRPDFGQEGSPVMECAWVLWEKHKKNSGTIYQILDKPF